MEEAASIGGLGGLEDEGKMGGLGEGGRGWVTFPSGKMCSQL